MNLELKLQLLKFCMFLFNILFLGLGLSVAGCGIWILFDKENFLSVLSSVELSTVGFGLLVTGCAVIVVVVIGCVGVHREDRVLLLTYLSLLVVLVLGQLFITLLLFINRRKIEESLDTAFDILIVNYGNSSSSSSSTDSLVNNLQIQRECCGRTGPADWLKNSYIMSLSLNASVSFLPCSCFVWSEGADQSLWCTELLNASQPLKAAGMPLFGTGNSSWKQGCKQSVSGWLHENIVTIVAMDLSLLGIQVVQFAVVISLYKVFGKKDLLKTASQLIDPDPVYGDFDDSQVINYENGQSTETLMFS